MNATHPDPHQREIDALRAELAEAREAHRLVARRLAEYERSRPARFIRSVWSAERAVRDFAIRRRLEYRAVRRRLTGSDAPASTPPDTVGAPVQFEQEIEPTVSIVVPVHGQLSATAACLRSIAQAATDIEFEVIVVDDASPDDTAAWLARCEGLRVVTNDDNLGYLRSTNLGAAAARGRFICLLNNDTLVHDGWLDALVRTFTDHDDVGAVGSTLLFPDGSVQEVGGVIWNDGSGHNMGRGGSPADPALGFVRDVDYASAACLLVDAPVWRDLDGFDERYAPAYYEDTDMAFRIRRAGLRVLVQPAARVTHLEGVSHGTDAASGLKAGQVTNRTVFTDTWRDVLETHPRRGTHPEIASWRSGELVVVIDRRLPAADQDSGALRMTRIVELLSERARVAFVALDGVRREPHASRFERRGVRLALGAGQRDHLLETFGETISLVLVSRPEVAAASLARVRELAPKAPVAYDMVDFHGLRIARQAEHLSEPADTDESAEAALERTALAEADIVVAISDDEAAAVADLRTGPALVLPNVHDAARSAPDFEDRHGVLFVGNWLHAPNRDALQWLRDDIMPLVWQRDDSIVLHVVGNEIPDSFRKLRRGGTGPVEVHGWVPYLEPIVDQVRVNVAPLRFGAGLKGKVGDALVRGLPTVCTAVGAEGFGPVSDALVVADTASDIAERILALHADAQDWRRRAEQGRRLVLEHFGPDRARAALGELLAAASAVERRPE